MPFLESVPSNKGGGRSMRMTGVNWQPFRMEFPILFGGQIESLWVGEGWFHILWDLCGALEALTRTRQEEGFPPVRIRQVKEKYGTMRMYVEGGTEEVDDLIDAAEVRSETICEVCGAPGSIHTIRGWDKALCAFHELESKLASGTKFEDIRKDPEGESDSWESVCQWDPIMSRDPRLYLWDIVKAVAEITAFVGEMTPEEFAQHELTRDAVLYLVGVIGTASRQIPIKMIGPTPSAAWCLARALRDHLTVECFGLTDDALWLAIKADLPRLAHEVERVLNSTEH